MSLRRRTSSSILGALATLALSLSCGDSGGSASGTGGGSPGGTGGVSGASGGTGAAGTASSGGSTTGGASSGGSTTGGASSGGLTIGGTTGGGDTSGGTTGGDNTTGSTTGGGDTTGGGTTGGGTMGSGGASTGGDAASGGASTGGDAAGGSAGAAGSGTVGCGSPAGLASGRASIDVGGKMREYILSVPADYDPNHPYKLVFGWHPWGGSAQQTASGGYFGLSSVSDGQAILVAPEGQDYQDNGLGWGNVDGEDIDFLHAMVDRFSAELCIDQDRIFSTGFSFGAMFSFTLACTEDSRMRAIAPMAGNTFTSGGCEDSTRPVATLAFIGTDDSLLSGHRQAVQVFVERNGCSAETALMQPSWCDGLSSTYLPCTCMEYQGCDPGYPVIECEYTGGHMFAPSSGATLWEFFSQF